MNLYEFDPTQNPRWEEHVQTNPKASVFHTTAWLQALQRTYGFRPVAFTTSPLDRPLLNALVFCQIRSWLTGNRMVSVPFSDHCEPLVNSETELNDILENLRTELRHGKCEYIELRPLNRFVPRAPDLHPVKPYRLHRLDLRPDLNDLFRSLDRDCVQRRILRAERARVTHERGRSDKLLQDFYDLLVITRKRHRLPPQPYCWFRNILDCMNDAVTIRVAYKGEVPIAAVLTLRFRNTVYYKYGCSDAKYKNLGGMPLLLWQTIEESKDAGAEEFDLGRSDVENPGLISFKNHWAQASTELVYWKFLATPSQSSNSRNLKIPKWIFACMPKLLLTTTGRLLYRHMG